MNMKTATLAKARRVKCSISEQKEWGNKSRTSPLDWKDDLLQWYDWASQGQGQVASETSFSLLRCNLSFNSFIVANSCPKWTRWVRWVFRQKQSALSKCNHLPLDTLWWESKASTHFYLSSLCGFVTESSGTHILHMEKQHPALLFALFANSLSNLLATLWVEWHSSVQHYLSSR